MSNQYIDGYFTDGWLTDTHLKLAVLLRKSMDTSMALSDAIQAFKKAREASASFCTQYQQSEATMLKTISNNILKGENIFIAVKTSLFTDGSFWCRVWKQKTEFDEEIIDKISRELGWMEKDMAAKKVSSSILNTPMFYFSTLQDSYLRVIIEKCFEDHVFVRLLDIGTAEEVSLNAQFYLLPQSNIKKFPFLCIQGQLCKDEIIFPYEVKWMFKDLTYNQVLFAQINNIADKQFPSYQMEIKSLLTDTNISKELLLKLKQNQDNAKKKDEPQNSQKLHQLDESVFRKPLPIVATVESVKQDVSKKKKNDGQTKRPSRNNSQSRSRDNSHSRSRNNSEPRSRSNSESKSQNNSQTRKDGSQNKSNLKSGKVAQNGNRKIPSRCSSEEDLSNLKTTKMISKSTGSIITQKESSKNRQKETYEVNMEEQPCERKKKNTRERDNWTDKIPVEQLKNVPQILPPLLNLFYNSTTLRRESWNEIEFMNINSLLNSQARMLFCFYDVTKTKVLNSFTNGYLEIINADNHMFQGLLDKAQTHTQYFVLRMFKTIPKQCPSYFIYGIARLDSTVPNDDGHYPVSYLSLSRCTSPVHEWEISEGKPLAIMTINKAKDVVDWFRRTLISKNRVPVFPEYFPWCRVPPCLENLKKPNCKRQTKPVLRKILMTSETGHSTKRKQSDEPINSLPLQTVISEIEKEVWDISDDDQKSSLRKSDEQSKSVDDAKQTASLIHGYYDQSGMWYPTVVAKVVGEAIDDFVQVDFNQNYKPAPIQILQRPQEEIIQEQSHIKLDSEENNNTNNKEKDAVNGHHSPLSSDAAGTAIAETVESVSCVERPSEDFQRPILDLLSLVTITSDNSGEDELENSQRFERDCQIFGVSSSDFD